MMLDSVKTNRLLEGFQIMLVIWMLNGAFKTKAQLGVVLPGSIQQVVEKVTQLTEKALFDEARNSIDEMLPKVRRQKNMARLLFTRGWTYQKEAAFLTGSEKRVALEQAQKNYENVLKLSQYETHQATLENLAEVLGSMNEWGLSAQTLDKIPTEEMDSYEKSRLAIRIGETWIRANLPSKAFSKFWMARSLQPQEEQLCWNLISTYALLDPDEIASTLWPRMRLGCDLMFEDGFSSPSMAGYDFLLRLHLGGTPFHKIQNADPNELLVTWCEMEAEAGTFSAERVASLWIQKSEKLPENSPLGELLAWVNHPEASDANEGSF